MTPANDNSARRPLRPLRHAQGERNQGERNQGGRVRDLALPGAALAHFNGPFDPFDKLRVSGIRVSVACVAGVDLVAGGVHHAARITLRAAPASSGKLQPVTGSNLRAAPAEINAVAGALAAMLAELPVRGGILDRLS